MNIYSKQNLEWLYQPIPQVRATLTHFAPLLHKTYNEFQAENDLCAKPIDQTHTY